MPTFEVGKLIRDDLPQIYEQQGQIAEIEIREGEDLVEAWLGKIDEELLELEKANGSPDESIAELADVHELLDCLDENGVENEKTIQTKKHSKAVLESLGLTFHAVEQKQDVKRNKAGSFKKGVWLVRISMPEDNEWVDYYRREGYPEMQ